MHLTTDSVEGLKRTLVSKDDQEKTTYTQKVDFAKLRSELQTLEKNDHSLVKSDQDRITSDLEKLKQRLKEEIAKTQANVRLDLNLEKGRIREESSVHELKIRETDTKIDTEISNIRTQLETVKFQMYYPTIDRFCSSLTAQATVVRRLHRRYRITSQSFWRIF